MTERVTVSKDCMVCYDGFGDPYCSDVCSHSVCHRCWHADGMSVTWYFDASDGRYYLSTMDAPEGRDLTPVTTVRCPVCRAVTRRDRLERNDPLRTVLERHFGEGTEDLQELEVENLYVHNGNVVPRRPWPPNQPITSQPETWGAAFNFDPEEDGASPHLSLRMFGFTATYILPTCLNCLEGSERGSLISIVLKTITISLVILAYFIYTAIMYFCCCKVPEPEELVGLAVGAGATLVGTRRH